ncbi:hypothetical protein [Desulfofustis limnaeus]|jgi:hypothetical protein|uniref:Uncharacterized protein n=1 Tax=Desulfofustis limnaeus TaxID=2740163 RepID=A0ABM7W8N1_9BACT|nr:hypothetical protein [Desulfofustis limnaeus]MDX9894203.1 hypothetical protein [Desulfofustis sp.]BDD87287.1 hypothetical protein DPPLL_16520 [Desulfofustis limnaeus]
MTDQKQTPPPTTRRTRASRRTAFLVFLLLVAVGAGAVSYYLFLDRQPIADQATVGRDEVSPSEPLTPPLPQESAESTKPGQGIGADRQSTVDATGTGDEQAQTGEAKSDDQIASLALPTIVPTQPTPVTIESADGGPGKPQQVCQRLSSTVAEFYSTLDARPYIKDFQLGETSSAYFSRLIQKLVDNPPVVTGETDDLFTILQNTAHFFRVLGKDNIFILKGILDREKDTFERVLADFYELTDYPGCLKDRFDLAIGTEALYQYAGFFLNTMGGRLYLFRRDSMSRMVVNYYAILTIDEANRAGRNTYGIDLAPAIVSLIDEIESSSIHLKMRDHYLDTLYDLQVKYQ